MKDKMKDIINKVKKVFDSVKEKLSKITVLKKVYGFLDAHRLIAALCFFCVAILALILVATIGWGEFVVPVCVLMILEVAMAVLLHRSELWIHGILLLLHLIAGFAIGRMPLMALCMVAYTVTTLTQQFAFKKNEQN